MTSRSRSFEHAYRIAHAAGWHAGNRRMAEQGRAAWNAEDWDHAATTLLRTLASLG